MIAAAAWRRCGPLSARRRGRAHGTLRALVVEQRSDISPETVAALKGLTQRIDNRLGEVKAKVQAVRAEVDALQVRLDKRKSRLLFMFNLVALLSTLMLAWVVYTQVVVIQHHWARVRRPVAYTAEIGIRNGAWRRGVSSS